MFWAGDSLNTPDCCSNSGGGCGKTLGTFWRAVSWLCSRWECNSPCSWLTSSSWYTVLLRKTTEFLRKWVKDGEGLYVNGHIGETVKAFFSQLWGRQAGLLRDEVNNLFPVTWMNFRGLDFNHPHCFQTPRSRHGWVKKVVKNTWACKRKRHGNFGEMGDRQDCRIAYSRIAYQNPWVREEPLFFGTRISSDFGHSKLSGLKVLRPDAVSLVDAWGHSDHCLNSALGRRDGRVPLVPGVPDW